MIVVADASLIVASGVTAAGAVAAAVVGGLAAVKAHRAERTLGEQNGHGTLVDMTTEALEHIGEVKGDVKALRNDLNAHALDEIAHPWLAERRSERS